MWLVLTVSFALFTSFNVFTQADDRFWVIKKENTFTITFSMGYIIISANGGYCQKLATTILPSKVTIIFGACRLPVESGVDRCP